MYCGQKNTFFHTMFTQPGKALLVQPCIYVVLTILPKSNVLQKATFAIPRDTSKVHKLACLRLAQGKFCDVLILAWVRKLALHDLRPRSFLAVAHFNDETLHTSENERAMSCYT